MINLLPLSVREDILYARRNSFLSKWVTRLVMVVITLSMIIGAGYFYIGQNTNNLEKQVDQSKQQLASQKVEETQKKVEDISGNIKLITKVLSKQVLFSKLLKQVGTVMPPDTILDKLELNNEVSGGLDISALAKSYDSATQVQVNLQDKDNGIFEKVDINSVSCSSTSGTAKPDPSSIAAQYPCRVSLRALFKKNNPYLLVNDRGINKPAQPEPKQ